MTEPTQEQLAEWEAWCDERPTRVAEVARRLPPWRLYRLKTTDQRVSIIQYDEHEDGGVAVSVDVSADHNFLMFERHVFGVEPSDLEPCDPPSQDELVGAVLKGEQVGVFIDDVMRPTIFGAEEAERIRREIAEREEQ